MGRKLDPRDQAAITSIRDLKNHIFAARSERAIIRGIAAKVLIHLSGSARIIDASISCHDN